MTVDQKTARLASAYTRATATDDIVADLCAGLAETGTDYALVALFCGHQLDGKAIPAGIARRFPGARIIACSSAGEFTESATDRGGTAAVAFPTALVPRVATATADLSRGVTDGINTAVAALEFELGAPLRDLDTTRHVGLVLMDGLTGREEEVNSALGRIAPFLSFIGGSAGDELEFQRTWVATEHGCNSDAAVLAVLELAVGFSVLKTCSFVPSEKSFTITRVDPATRTVYEVDGKPVMAEYAAALGVEPGQLDSSVFMAHPLGVMIDNEPWIRSPMQATTDGGLKFYCQIPQGTTVHVMNSTDLVADTKAAFDAAREELGGNASGAILFNCILRRLELDASGKHGEFLAAFDGTPLAGFHTYGESWLGHINQTCTGLILG